MDGKLVEAVRARGIPFETSESGEWVRFPCPHAGHRYIVRSRLADGYHAWCVTNNAAKPDWFLMADDAVRSKVPPNGSVSTPRPVSPMRSPYEDGEQGFDAWQVRIGKDA